MIGLFQDEDTPENRRELIRQYLMSKRGESESEVGLPEPSPMGAREPQMSPMPSRMASKAPESSLLGDYDAAGDDSEARSAEADTKRARMAGLLGDAFTTFATARGRASGYQPTSGDFFKRVGEVNDPALEAAKSRMKGKQEGVLTRDKLAQTILERGQAQEDRTRRMASEDKASTRSDAEYAQKEKRMGELNDPNSPLSEMYRRAALKMNADPEALKGLSASQIQELMNPIQKTYEIDQRAKASESWGRDKAADREERRLDREAGIAMRRADRREEYEQKRQDKLEDEARQIAQKGNKDDEEFNQRYDNINKNLDSLSELIKEDGTFELIGDHSAKMDKRLYDIALDYAKIVDPASVAREGEVAAAQRYLLPITGLGVRNKTAQKHIEDMRATLRQRMDAKNSNRKNTSQSAGMAGGGFPKTVRNAQGATATVSDETELKEAQAEGFK